MTRYWVATVVLLIACSLPILCQVTAYRGESEQVKEIVPPMVLEIPLKGMVEQGENKEWVTTETRGFSCLGVVVEKVTVRFRTVGRSASQYELRGMVILRNIKPEDTQTSISYALAAGSTTLATDSDGKFATEEDKPRFQKFKLVVPAKEVQSLRECVLRISLTVVPD